MKYRVAFQMNGLSVFTEWYDMLEDAVKFVEAGDRTCDVFCQWIEDSEGTMV